MRSFGLAFMLISATQPALAWTGPVCREPSVVDEMSREMHASEYYARLDSRLISEQPTADPNVMRCLVCVLYGPYDMLRFGDRPVQSCRARVFDAQAITREFVVSGPR